MYRYVTGLKRWTLLSDIWYTSLKLLHIPLSGWITLNMYECMNSKLCNQHLTWPDLTLLPRPVDTSSSRRTSWPEPSAGWSCFTRCLATKRSPQSLTRTRGLLTSGRRRAACTWGWHCWPWSSGSVECRLQQWLDQSGGRLTRLSIFRQSVCRAVKGLLYWRCS